MPIRVVALKYLIILKIRPGWPPECVRRTWWRAIRRAGQTPIQDAPMEAERQNQIIARIEDYTERQELLRRYL